MSKNKFYDFKTTGGTSNITQYCMCTSNNNPATFYCPLGLTQDPGRTGIYGRKRQM